MNQASRTATLGCQVVQRVRASTSTSLHFTLKFRTMPSPRSSRSSTASSSSPTFSFPSPPRPHGNVDQPELIVTKPISGDWCEAVVDALNAATATGDVPCTTDEEANSDNMSRLRCGICIFPTRLPISYSSIVVGRLLGSYFPLVRNRFCGDVLFDPVQLRGH